MCEPCRVPYRRCTDAPRAAESRRASLGEVHLEGTDWTTPLRTAIAHASPPAGVVTTDQQHAPNGHPSFVLFLREAPDDGGRK